MKNDLLNTKLLEKYQDKFTLNVKKHDLLKEYIEKVKKEEFKDEVANYINFYEYILRGILGYKPDDLAFEGKVDDTSQRVEFALKFDDKKFMVIELKGQGTDLDKPQKGRQDSRSPVDQAFNYAVHIGSAEWIMVSDYEMFRLYNYHKKTNYISFNARELTDKKIFKWFMLAFSRESHEKGYLDKISSQTQIIERKLEDEFYKLYHETRLMIIKELEEIREFEREDAVHYAQLLLNRYMFICFAEDMGLLPAQISVQTITNPIKSRSVRRNSIWHNLNDLFLDINEGDTSRDIFPYNGGLFGKDKDPKKREVEEKIEIRDLVEDPEFFRETRQGWIFNEYSVDIESLVDPYKNNINPIYKNLLTISSFDFRSDLDVNIMGHIFENSIGDLEDLKEDEIGRRKKEGVYYTPDYITDYICRNTIIPYLSKTGKPDTIEKLLDEYTGSEVDELDQKVKNIRIVDPACGSGAFLNRAADILLDIHQAIHNRKYTGTHTLDKHFDSVEERRSILLDNIFGVDLNEESVEITKLALFLNIFKRTVGEKEKAKPMQLPNIDKNIRCGNSLIDDPEYTDKPFKWEEEFKHIFEDGGFDVVIGNPPWGAELDEKSKKFIDNYYKTLEYQVNSYVVFLERTYMVLKDQGILGLITPPTWLYMYYFKNIRKFLISNSTFLNLIYLKYHAFEEVTSESSIICYKKTPFNCSHEVFNKIVKNEHQFINKDFSKVKQENWHKNYEDGFLFSDEINMFKKIFEKSEKLELSCKLTTGIKPYQKNKGTPKQTREDVTNKIYSSTEKLGEDYQPYLVGGNINRYKLDYPSDQWIKYGPGLAEPRPSMDFSKEKIVIRRTNDKIFAVIDKNEYLNLNSVHNLIITDDSDLKLEFILCLLNSTLIDTIYRYLVPDDGRVFSEVKIINLKKLPVPMVTYEQQKPFIEKSNRILQLNKELMDEINGFKEWLTTTFGVEKFSKKLDKYYELEFSDFLGELKKKKVDISSRKNQELLKKEFKNSLKVIKPLQVQIEETDAEIDWMVYRLYDLTEEEIQIIENSLKQ